MMVVPTAVAGVDLTTTVWLVNAILWGFFISWIVFGITLTVNKSKLFGAKKEFVKQRYKSSFVDGRTPGYIHWFWHAMWTCAMCLGFWVSLVHGLHYRVPFGSILMAYGLNWLYHCVESFLMRDEPDDEKKSD